MLTSQRAHRVRDRLLRRIVAHTPTCATQRRCRPRPPTPTARVTSAALRRRPHCTSPEVAWVAFVAPLGLCSGSACLVATAIGCVHREMAIIARSTTSYSIRSVCNITGSYSCPAGQIRQSPPPTPPRPANTLSTVEFRPRSRQSTALDGYLGSAWCARGGPSSTGTATLVVRWRGGTARRCWRARPGGRSVDAWSTRHAWTAPISTRRSPR